MFLTRLRKLSIRVRLPGNENPEMIYSISTNAHRATINKRVRATTTTQNFWTAKGHVTQMPKDSIRKNVNEATIVLAFPLDGQDMPMIANQ
jgi:hypothetical protein